MKKGLVTVFVVLGILVAGLLIWAFCFSEEGGFNGIFKAFAIQINNVWNGLTGDPSGDGLFDVNQNIFGENNNVADAQAGALD